MKKPVWRLLIVYMVLLLLAPGYLVYRHYNTLITGEPYKFVVQPYDPYDPFRGRYVALQSELSWSPEPYSLLGRDDQGYAVITEASRDKPKEQDYAKNLRLSRYYMNEKMAPEAERLQRSLAEEDILYLLVKVKNGNYVIEGLYLNDIRIEEHIAGTNR